MSEVFQYLENNKDLFVKENKQINEKYPANIWSFGHVNVYNDYFISSPPKNKDVVIDDTIPRESSPKIEIDPERCLFEIFHHDLFDIKQKLISLSNRERSKIKDKSMIIGSRYRFYIPLFDKNQNSSWAIYADPTILFLNNPRSLIENLDSSKTVYVCKHDNYSTKRPTKTLIPSIKYPFANFMNTLCSNMYAISNKEKFSVEELFVTYSPLQELYSPENFEKYDKLFAQKNLSQDDFMKACLAIFKDKKFYMIRNKGIASEQVLEEIYQRWYVNDEMESFDNFDYDRKNWSSFMIFNKEKFKLNWQQLDSYSIEELHQFKWCADEEIGELPLSWNHLVDEQEDISNPNALNFTVDSPGRYKSSGTSKLNQKYININIAQFLYNYYLDKDLETDTIDEIPKSNILKQFDFLIKPINELLKPTKLKTCCDELNVKELSPLEVLTTTNNIMTTSVDVIKDPQNNNNTAESSANAHTQITTQEFFDENYDRTIFYNGLNISDYVQHYYDSKNKVLDMVEILKKQIKNLTESDKKEITYLFYACYERVTARYRVDDPDTDSIEFIEPPGSKRFDNVIEDNLERTKCFSIRELTGRIL